MGADGTFDVLVTKPGCDSIRYHAGPEHRAEMWAARLTQALTGSAHPERTAIAVEPHADGDGCSSPAIGGDHACGLAVLIPREPPLLPAGAGFPDLFDRLAMVHGHDRAGELWSAACSLADRWAEDAEAAR
jgi:hypothetical protein